MSDFKVLSDWQTGDPPMPGWWLLRWTDSFTELAQWDGKEWWPEAGDTIPLPKPPEWRGLAFDPNAVSSQTTLDRPHRVGWFIEQENRDE